MGRDHRRVRAKKFITFFARKNYKFLTRKFFRAGHAQAANLRLARGHDFLRAKKDFHARKKSRENFLARDKIFHVRKTRT